MVRDDFESTSDEAHDDSVMVFSLVRTDADL